MKYFKFAKLVRDKIILRMKNNGQNPKGVRKLNDKDFVSELIKKVLEEAKEMETATDQNALKHELVDVLEVIEYLKKTINLTDKELETLKKQKREKNGSFDKRMYIERVGVDEDNEWFEYYINNPEKYPEIK